jgi:hypothetical protein
MTFCGGATFSDGLPSGFIPCAYDWPGNGGEGKLEEDEEDEAPLLFSDLRRDFILFRPRSPMGLPACDALWYPRCEREFFCAPGVTVRCVALCVPTGVLRIAKRCGEVHWTMSRGQK